MARPSDSPEAAFTQEEVEEMRNSLSRLSGPHVMEFYREAHRECAIERRPSAKAIQRLVVSWKLLSKWDWK